MLVFTMICSSGLQKRQYLQCFGALVCQNACIYNGLKLWIAETTVFTMIWSIDVQKQQYLQCFGGLATIGQRPRKPKKPKKPKKPIF